MDDDGFITEPAHCDLCGLELLEEPVATADGVLSLQLNCLLHGTRLEWLQPADE